VIHLDPRLRDGSSAAATLSHEREVLRTIAPSALGPQEFLPFTFENAAFIEAPDWNGTVVRAADYNPAQGIDHTYLVSAEEVDAAQINLIEIDVVVHQKTNATLSWRPGASARDLGREQCRVDAPVDASTEVQTVRFRLAGEVGWRGRVRALTIVPVWKGLQAFQIHAIRFVREGFSYGDQPLVDGGDGGLLGSFGDLRRSWPTSFGVPLFAKLVVPAGGRLSVASALPAALAGLDERLEFEIAARRGEGEFEPLESVSFIPSEDSERALRWLEWDVDLDAFRDDEIELRFGARRVRGQFVGGGLGHASVWWGAPIVTGRLERERRPNVLLVTLDTTRVDAIGTYGGPKQTPYLDQLAQEAIVFENAWTPCNSTLPAHTSMLTGLEVSAHGVLNNRSTLAPQVPLLSELLRDAGYRTAAAVSTHHLEAGYSGLGRGFDQYLSVQTGAQVNGELTVAGALRWLETWQQQGEAPVFLWLHLFDPHTPYGPPDDFVAQFAQRSGRTIPPKTLERSDIGPTPSTKPGEFLEGVTNSAYVRFLYDAGVAYTDQLVQRLIDGFDQRTGRAERILVIAADHGESLGENGVWYGHQMLFPVVTQVPLIVQLPGAQAQRRSDRVSTQAIARTICDVLGLSGLAPNASASLLRPLTDERTWFTHSDEVQLGFRSDATHFFVNNGEYLQLGPARSAPDGATYFYDAQADPGCEQDLSTEQAQKARRLAQESRAWLASVQTGLNLERDLSDSERERLKALGYATGHDEGADE